MPVSFMNILSSSSHRDSSKSRERWKHTKRTFRTLTIRVKIKIARTYCRVDFHHQWKLCLPQFQITPRTSGANMHTFREYVPSVRWKSVSRPLCQPKSAQNEGGNGVRWVFAGTEVRWTRRGGLMSFYYIKICSNCNGKYRNAVSISVGKVVSAIRCTAIIPNTPYILC